MAEIARGNGVMTSDIGGSPVVTSETNYSSSEWFDFFSEYQAFEVLRSKEQASGVNDYSLLNSLLKVNDEVRLHSRFLYSLLNPKGKHNQGCEFAKVFMSVLGKQGEYSGWFKNLDNLKIYKERDSIDIYLTDGERFVIIENKLNAPDQDKQVERYIAHIQAGDNAPPPENILFVYLSKGRDRPSTYSLGDFEVVERVGRSYLIRKGDEQEKTENQVRYVNCHYDEGVQKWIEGCEGKLERLKTSGNVTNLLFALREYRHVVQLATKNYKGKVMSLEGFLIGSDAESSDRINCAFDIEKKLPGIKAGWLSNAFGAGMDDLLKAYLDDDRLVPVIDGDCKLLKDEKLEFKSGDAADRFDCSSKRVVKNKGRFWRLSSGAHKDKIALVVFFGSRLLHIGLLPISIVGSDVFINSNGKDELIKLCELKLNELKLEEHKPINKVLPGFISYAEPLDQAIRGMAIFKNSNQAGLVDKILKALL
jgi:hypothetical protein